MPQDHRNREKREYITACFAAMFMAVVGLFAPDEHGQQLLDVKVLIFFIVMLAAIAAKMIYTLKSAATTDAPVSMQPEPSRLRKMIFIWYALSLVLAVPFTYKTANRILNGQADRLFPLEWMIASASVLIGTFALWRLYDTFIKVSQDDAAH